MTNEMVKWSSQLYLQILARKKIIGLQWDSNPWPKICSCLSTTAMTTFLFRLYSRSSNQLNLTRAKRFLVKCTFMSRLFFLWTSVHFTSYPYRSQHEEDVFLPRDSSVRRSSKTGTKREMCMPLTEMDYTDLDFYTAQRILWSRALQPS